MNLSLYWPDPFWSWIYLKHLSQTFRPVALWRLQSLASYVFLREFGTGAPHPILCRRSSAPSYSCRSPTVPGRVAGAHGALPLPHRHPAELLAAAAGGARGHRPDAAQLRARQLTAAFPAVRAHALTPGPSRLARERGGDPSPCSFPCAPIPLAPTLAFPHLCLPPAHPPVPSFTWSGPPGAEKRKGRGKSLPHSVARPLGDCFYHFLIKYLYEIFKSARAELQGGGQPPRMGRRNVWLKGDPKLTSSTLTLRVARNWEKLFPGVRAGRQTDDRELEKPRQRKSSPEIHRRGLQEMQGALQR